MNQLIFLLILGGLLFALSLLALFRTPSKHQVPGQAMETLLKIVPLPSLEFRHSGVLFDDADYRSIATEPRLRAVAEQLRRDRRRLALSWLRLLQADVFTLWRFRRLLTTFGVSAGLREEFATARRAVGLILFLLGLRLFVALFGPFAFASVAAKIRDRVRGYSCFCGETLSRLPMYRVAQLETDWRNFGAA
jgi:hypothetical protein